MQRAERLAALGNEQWGSREGKSAVQALLDKHLVYSIARMSRMNMATMDNDAKSCYDRIVMVFASLCSQRLGMDPKACELFLTTLEQAQYHIKTQLGVSEEFYCTTESATIHGPGQGGRGSPCIWIIISCLLMECLVKHSTGIELTARLLMECLVKHSTGIELTAPVIDEILQQFTTGFVDDVTLWIGNMQRSLSAPESPETILQETTEAAQWWERLLYTTGGKLELQKCFVYLIYWIFDEEGRPRLMEPDEFPSHVEITDSTTGAIVQIETRSSLESHKTLGVMENPDGNYTAEASRLLGKSEKLARQVYTATLSRNEATQIYHTIWRPSMNYSLPVGTLNRESARQIQSKMTRATLQAMGYNEHSPSEIVFGPVELGGIGLIHLSAEQGTLKIKLMLQELRKNGPLGKKLRIAIQWLQRVAGVSLPVLEYPNGWLPQIDDEAYFHTVREFLEWSNMGLRVEGILCPSPKREHDTVLMDKLMADELQEQFTDDDVHSVNRVRMYLRAETLADISNAAGNEISLSAWQCEPSAKLQDRGQWPNQARPGPKTIKVWQRFLANMCKYSQRKLLDPLGAWTTQPNQLDFDSWIHPDSGIIALWDWGYWSLHESTNALRNGLYIGSGIGSTTLEHALKDPAGTLHVASDGGASGDDGTFGWAMSYKGYIILEGFGKAWGGPMSSYRAEGFGKLAWLVLIQGFITRYGDSIKCRIVSYCDNAAVVKQTTITEGTTPRLAPLCSDYDVISEINAVQEFLLDHRVWLEPTKHIKGHQDKTTAFSDLTLSAKLNVRADELATLAKGDGANTPTCWRFDQCDAFLVSDNSPQSSKEVPTMQWKWRNYELKNYYCSRFRLPRPILEKINWPGYAGARKRLTAAEAKFSTKFLTGWLPVGKRLARQGSAVCNCHSCNQLETCDHVMQCPLLHEDTNEFIKAFADELRRVRTMPEITTALCRGLETWLRALETGPAQRQEKVPKVTAVAYEEQSRIGWGLLAKGLLSEEWSRVQEHIGTKGDSNRTVGDTWNAKVSAWLIRKCLERWKKRNKEIHDPEGQATDFISRQEQELRARVIYLYSRELEVSHTHRTMIFSIPLAERLSQPWLALQSWVQLNEQTIESCAKQFREKELSGQKDIRTLFTPNGRRKSTNATAPQQRKPTRKRVQSAITAFVKRTTTKIRSNKAIANATSQANAGLKTIVKRCKQTSLTAFGRVFKPKYDGGVASVPPGTFQND